MADIKSTERHEFPEVKGKIVDAVEFIVEADYYGIDIRFQDKTGMAFSMEPGIVTFPEFSDWTEEEGWPIKEYPPIHSKGLRSK